MSYCIIISENHRIVKGSRDLWRLSGPISLLWAGSARAGCSQPFSVGSWISPRRETLQPLWATCFRAWPPSQWKSFFLHLKTISCISVCALCLLFCRWALLRRAWLHLLYFLPSKSRQEERFWSEKLHAMRLGFKIMNVSLCNTRGDVRLTKLYFIFGHCCWGGRCTKCSAYPNHTTGRSCTKHFSSVTAEQERSTSRFWPSKGCLIDTSPLSTSQSFMSAPFPKVILNFTNWYNEQVCLWEEKILIPVFCAVSVDRHLWIKLLNHTYLRKGTQQVRRQLSPQLINTAKTLPCHRLHRCWAS